MIIYRMNGIYRLSSLYWWYVRIYIKIHIWKWKTATTHLPRRDPEMKGDHLLKQTRTPKGQIWSVTETVSTTCFGFPVALALNIILF